MFFCGKRSKDRVTVMVTANMSGSEKLKLLVVGKSQQPHCFSEELNLWKQITILTRKPG